MTICAGRFVAVLMPSSALVMAALCQPASALTPSAESLIRTIGTSRGLCALVGSKAGNLTLALARKSELILYVQVPDAQEASIARKAAHKVGLLGSRVFVFHGRMDRIHLADNLADAVVVSGTAAVPKAEFLRVLRPGGKAIVGKSVTVKPAAAGIDDWSHPYHGPDNNPQSNDQLARAPYLTQFLAKPYYCAMPQMTVSAGGRLFKAFGHIAFRTREWKTLNKLMAMNAFNGTTLWQRDLSPGFMIHRNTLIATRDALYLGDDKSCKIMDPATGRIKGEIVIDRDTADGPVWKWMAIEKGVLYALVGAEQDREEVIRQKKSQHGWGWTALGKGYDNRHAYPWGFSKTLLAIDPRTRKILWTYKAAHLLDSRALCLKNGRIYFYAHLKELGCLNARDGSLVWKTRDPKLFEAIGVHHKAQHYTSGWASSTYMKCTDDVLFFAGPQRTRLVAASAENGRLLWQYPQGNFQLVVRDDALYALGIWGKVESRKFEKLTGKQLPNRMPRRSTCTRATGSVDSIFMRGGSTARYNVAGDSWDNIGPVRPACTDGVIVSDGQLFIGPWMCDCNNSLVGIVSLCPAGDFKFSRNAEQSERLESHPPAGSQLKARAVSADDWPTYRKDNARSAGTRVDVPAKSAPAWTFSFRTKALPTAAVTAGDRAFVSGTDGIVRAFDSKTGQVAWTAYTGGAAVFPPTVWEGRVYVGSGDGWVYCLAAKDGSLLWRFRAAPAERIIPVYGRLSSTWPVGSGVLVADGVAYAAAGISNYDGTHVYALDARTGHIKWQNNTSGKRQGVAVQGHFLLHKERLYLAGGNNRSPGVYDIRTGKETKLDPVKLSWPWRNSGRELFLVGGKIRISQHLLYSPEEDFLWAAKPRNRFVGYVIRASSPNAIISQGPRMQIVRFDQTSTRDAPPKVKWEKSPFEKHYALAVAGNAAVVVGRLPAKGGATEPVYGLAVLGLADGRLLYRHALPGCPVQWGLAVDHAGRIIVSLRNGTVVCFR